MGRRKKTIRLPTDREISLMLSRIKLPRDRLMIVLALKLGLRASEIIHLRLSDINWESKTISFIGKGNRPAVLPLTDEVIGYLERALKVRPTNCHEFVIWNTRSDRGISRFAVYYLIRKYGRDVGIKLWPHLLRHRFGTDIMRNGDIYRAKEALRHKKLSTTADVYAHLDVESQREDFELLDSRHWLIRFLSKFKPPMPSFLLEKPAPVFIGDTIGRRDELAKLNENLKAGIHAVLCGPRGCGASHLLRQIKGNGIYHLEGFKPPREKLLELCGQMKDDGVLPEIKGKATATVFKSLIGAVEGKHYTIVIDSLSTISRDGIEWLKKLSGHFTILASVETKHRSKLKEIFYGSHETVDIGNLNDEDAYKLADLASIDLPTTPEDRELLLRRIVAESRGNPKAIMEIIDKKRKQGKVVDAATEISHEAIQEPLSATPFLSAFLIIAMVSRYAASTVGMPDVKIILIVAIAVVAVLVLTDRVLKQDN